MIETSRDAVLLEKIRKGDADAFDRLMERYGDRIFGFGMRVCGEREDARDVMQETLLQAFRSLRSLKEPQALRSWLYRVASNACLMKRRKRKFEPERELSLEDLMPRGEDRAPVEIPDASSLPDEDVARLQVQETVRAAIRALPRHYRIVLVLRDMEQLSTRETSEALGLPESTVKMRLHRARLMVRQELEAAVRGNRGPGKPS
jgi:RNA polymerase sigma-70 factor (ECF subfamily)